MSAGGQAASLRKQAKRPTIEAVAARANVSVTTVSHTLTGKGRVGLQTRGRVLQVIEEMGYVANPQARALKSGKTMTLLAELPQSDAATALQSAFISDFLIGAAARAIERGYLLTVAGRGPDAASPAGRFDGAILVDPPGAGAEPSAAWGSEVPIVTVGRGAGPDVAGWVDNDAAHGVVTVLEHLRAAGYERPALLTTRAPVSYATDALDAYRGWADEHDLRPVVGYVGGGYPDVARGRAATARLLRRSARPDAVIATTEPLAVGAMRAIDELGLRCPEDIGLASNHDSERLRAAEVPTTALDLRADELGRGAVDLLIEALAEKRRPRSRVVESVLVERRSTARHDRSPRQR